MNQKVVFDFDEFFKDYFNTDDIKERIYNQMAKTIAKGIDIDLAKTPLVDLITGYTRYKQMEFEVKNLENRLKEKDKVVNDLLKRISNLEFEVEDKQREIEFLKQINEEHQRINGELRVENERLNNIINEFEKSIDDKLKEFEDNKDYFIDETTLKDLKNELQELKGDGDSENL